MKKPIRTYLSRRLAALLLHCAPVMVFLTAIFLGTVLPTRLHAQYWHVGINQGVMYPLSGVTSNSPQFNWMPSLAVHYFPKNNPLVLGGSISMQFFGRGDSARLNGENFELLSFPISMCFQYLLLPEPPFRPYYGIETGVTWFRYRFFDKERFIGSTDNIGLLVTPNAGFKIEIFDGLDIDLNVRFQLLFHERFEWGSAGKALAGYNMLSFSVGLNYEMFRQY
ncbi:MAG: hypothetical protein MUF71_05845 [Candidatus Kapabacteria bacterium]|jgi:hypothetical protein|nr:hypothetical protein [Candidatus Kapabacteria bacterium]